MQADEAKLSIIKALGNDIKFEGHFDSCFENLKMSQQMEIIDWAKSCKDMKENPIQSKKDKETLGFV